MVETMRAADGVGLAAPQVGILRRIVVIETPEDGLIELINPKIIAFAGEQRTEEGCLSVPDRRGEVLRSQEIVIEYADLHALTAEVASGCRRDRRVAIPMVRDTVKGFTAVIFQHEIDHLDGILYIDRL
jgi:peptide deformylase